jgi:hypothetical protein
MESKKITLDAIKLEKAFKGLEAEEIIKFIDTLLHCRFLLDNYIVHREEITSEQGNDDWTLKRACNNEKSIGYTNTFKDTSITSTSKLIKQLSMFEATYASSSGKNYLWIILKWLMDQGENIDAKNYSKFLDELSKSYLCDIYLNVDNTSKNGDPKPDVFYNTYKGAIPKHINDKLETEHLKKPKLFIFNYLNYLLWAKDKGSKKEYKDFYFASSKTSLEHFIATKDGQYSKYLKRGKEENLEFVQLQNSFGNFAMVTNQQNSARSNWALSAKINQYKDDLNIGPKLQIMCEKFGEISKDDSNIEDVNITIRKHAKEMVEVLLDAEHSDEYDKLFNISSDTTAEYIVPTTSADE